MRVITPGAVAEKTGSKYLGILVAAKYARKLNEFRRGEVFEEPAPGAELPEKLTTISLGQVAAGTVDFQLVERRPGEL
jgi:DNA-directed RNA polymerase omega subunit